MSWGRASAAGAGGVGSYAIQIAKKAGARVITTCGADNEKFVEKLGADFNFNYRAIGEEAIRARVMTITGQEGVDAWLDTVGPASAATGLSVLKYDGTLVGGLDSGAGAVCTVSVCERGGGAGPCR